MLDRRELLTAVATLTAGAVLPPVAHANAADKTVKVAFSENWEAIDPFFDSTRSGIVLTRQVYDHLLIIDWQTGEFRPLLAESYEWKDERTLEFQLRRDVLFHNGDSFTADDVVATFEFAMNPDSKVIRRVFEWLSSVEKIDDYRVRFNYKYTYPASLNFFATQLSVYSKRHLRESSKETLINKPIGTGPFRLTSHEIGKSATLERFSGYRQNSPKAGGNAQKIIVSVVPEPSTQVAMLMSGSVDWIWRVSADLLPRLHTVRGLSTESIETMRFSGIFFDAAGRSGVKAIQDERVRTAIMQAINRQAYRDHLMQGNTRILPSFCFPSQLGCSSEVDVKPFNPGQSREKLKSAGYPDGFEVTMLTSSPRPEVEAIVADLRSVGIRLNARFLEYPAIRKAMVEGQAPMVMLNWGSFSVNDVATTAGYFYSGNELDMAKDPEVSAWVNEAASTVDAVARRSKYKLALQRIAEKVYFVPLTSYPSNVARRANLSVPTGLDECPEFYLATWS